MPSVHGMGRIRVLIVSENSLCGEGLQCLVRETPGFAAPELLIGCGDAELLEFVRIKSYQSPDVIVLMPPVDPDRFVEWIRSLQARFSRARILCLEERIRRLQLRIAIQYRLAGYWCGVDGFPSLCQAICQVASGGVAIPSQIRRFFTRFSNESRVPCWRPFSEMERLTPRQRQIFLLLASGCSLHQCAEFLHISESTVDNHKITLMRKLRVHRTVELVWLAVNDQWITHPIGPEDIRYCDNCGHIGPVVYCENCPKVVAAQATNESGGYG